MKSFLLAYNNKKMCVLKTARPKCKLLWRSKSIQSIILSIYTCLLQTWFGYHLKCYKFISLCLLHY